MNERKQKIEAIFLGATELSSPEERETFLSRECAQDAELRREVDELLQSAVAAEAAFQTRAHEPALEQAGARIGHYRLLQRIGEGGCGVVYMAEQETPGAAARDARGLPHVRTRGLEVHGYPL